MRRWGLWVLLHQLLQTLNDVGSSLLLPLHVMQELLCPCSIAAVVLLISVGHVVVGRCWDARRALLVHHAINLSVYMRDAHRADSMLLRHLAYILVVVYCYSSISNCSVTNPTAWTQVLEMLLGQRSNQRFKIVHIPIRLFRNVCAHHRPSIPNKHLCPTRLPCLQISGTITYHDHGRVPILALWLLRLLSCCAQHTIAP